MKNHIAVRMMMSVTLLLPNSILYFPFFNQQRLTDIWTRISNQIHNFPWVWLLIMPHLQRSFWTWVSNHIPQVNHYNDVITGAMASQITSPTIVYSFVYLGTDKKTSKPCVIGLCEGSSPVIGEFLTQMISNEENVFMSWRHHEDYNPAEIKGSLWNIYI